MASMLPENILDKLGHLFDVFDFYTALLSCALVLDMDELIGFAIGFALNWLAIAIFVWAIAAFFSVSLIAMVLVSFILSVFLSAFIMKGPECEDYER